MGSILMHGSRRQEGAMVDMGMRTGKAGSQIEWLVPGREGGRQVLTCRRGCLSGAATPPKGTATEARPGWERPASVLVSRDHALDDVSVSRHQAGEEGGNGVDG